MTHIFKKLCENSNYRIQDESLECVKKYFKTRVSAENFGNGRGYECSFERRHRECNKEDGSFF